MTMITRRGLVGASAVGRRALLLSGCDQLAAQPGFRKILFSGDKINQRLATRAQQPRRRSLPNFAPIRCHPTSASTARSDPNTSRL